MAIRENIVTPEVKANGYGSIDEHRFARAIDQIATGLQVQGRETEAGRYFRFVVSAAAAERKFN